MNRFGFIEKSVPRENRHCRRQTGCPDAAIKFMIGGALSPKGGAASPSWRRPTPGTWQKSGALK